MKTKLKLPRLSVREHHVLRALGNVTEPYEWIALKDMATRTTLHPVSGLASEFEALRQRHFVEQNSTGLFRITPYGAWAQLVWEYHYRGALRRTAVEVFGVSNLKLMPGAIIFYEVNEEALGRAFAITANDDEAYQEYLEELKLKGESED